MKTYAITLLLISIYPVTCQSSSDFFSRDIFSYPSNYLYDHWHAGDEEMEAGYPASIVINSDKTANVDGLNCSWSHFHRDRHDLIYSNLKHAVNEITVECPGLEEFYVREREALWNDEIIEIIFHQGVLEKVDIDEKDVFLRTYKLHQYYTQKGFELLKERKQKSREPTKKWGGNTHKN